MNNKLLVRTIDNAEDLISRTLSKRFENVTEKIIDLNEKYQHTPDDVRLSIWVSEVGDELKYIAELLKISNTLDYYEELNIDEAREVLQLKDINR